MMFHRRSSDLVLAVLLFLSMSALGCTAQTAASPAPAATSVTPDAQPVERQLPAASVAAPGEAMGVTTAAVPLTADGHALHELSPLVMFMSADLVVKAVMVSLMVASLITWTILFGKTLELAAGRRRLTHELAQVGEARMIAQARLALSRRGLVADLLGAAAGELEMSGGAATRSGIKERVESRFADIARAEMQGLRRGMGLLATIGSTAPFIGLFGTVWGIMNSFIGISKSQTTNLAVVAPGIAEALLATATGLVAAIPAVIIYNHFSRSTRSYQLVINRAVGVMTRLLSRELDHGTSRTTQAAE